MNNKNLAVIILNYNDPDNTIRYVGEIEKYKRVDKIIVIDNKSPDGSFDKLLKLKSDKVDVIESEENRGYAYGNNYAIRYLNEKYGKFKYIAISNPDVDVPEESYNQCLDFLDNHNKVAICAPRMYDINDKPHQLSGWKERSLKGDIRDSSPFLTALYMLPHIERYEEDYLNQDVAYVDCVAGSFFIIKHSMFEKVGYFDEKTFLYFEEDILGVKLKREGYKNVVLNTCKFNHFESVSVDRTMSFYKKFRNLQKSKKYFHKTYNPKCNKWYSKWKLLFLDFVTFNRPIEDKLKLEKLGFKLNGIVNQNFFVLFVKLILFIIQIVLLPFTYLFKLFRTKKRVLYFSLVTWKWIKQRPHFISLGIAKTGLFKVDYRYQTLYDKYMPDSNHFVNNDIEKVKGFKIKPFKIFPAVTKFKIVVNTILSLIRTSFWNYDTIILTHPNQINFFFMKIQKMKGVNFIYEAMDNYEEWEPSKPAYLYNQNRLVFCSKHIITSAQKLKDKFIDLYKLPEDRITVIRNGYDKHTFENYEQVETNIKHPAITYIGTIDDWFDFDSIFSYAKKNKDINFYIIGPVNKSVKPVVDSCKLKNVYFPGPIEHHLVPKYIDDSNVMIMPFIINNIIEFVDPVKLYEYLYMKKNIVSSYWEELKQFENMVLFYKDKNDFSSVLDKALKNSFKTTKEYNKLIDESTWDKRLINYISILKEMK